MIFDFLSLTTYNNIVENNKPFSIMLFLSGIYSFLSIPGDLPFVAASHHFYFCAARVLWGVLILTFFGLQYYKKIVPKKLIIPYLIVMMLYSFHGQWYLPGYYLGYVELVFMIGLFFPVEKKAYRIITVVSCFIMIYLIIHSPASYNLTDLAWSNKFKMDAIVAVIVITIGSLVGHTYITLKREQKDEAYRKFLDIGKQAAFLLHDFKGLLSTPIFYADMLMDTLKTKTSQTEIIERLSSDLNFLQDYSKEFMKLTLPQNNTVNSKTRIEAHQVKNTLDILLRKHLLGIEFSVTESRPFNIEVNSNKMIKVLYNAVLNSVEHIKQSNIKDAKIEILFKKDIIQIRDNGKGFPESIIKQLNQEEVIVSTKNNGSGIGTAIIKDLVKSMDGKIEFLNNNGAVINIIF